MRIVSLLFKSPEINPSNCKARSIPVLNPFDKYGRVFTFSWLGFMVAFLSWYAFPPLLTVTIRQDLHMTQEQVANSNIVALLATLLVRFIAGPLCDRFGPRLVFVGLLLCGSIPTAMAGLVTNPRGLIVLRFFVGILGGTFVPCQVWCTGFFDKKIVGTANSLAGGWGNAGGGITYFIMPAVYDSLVRNRGFSSHKAWRVSYVIPFIIIVFVALGMLLTCEDTPTGKWSKRHIWTGGNNCGTTNTDIIDITIGSPVEELSDKPSANQATTDVEQKGAEVTSATDDGSGPTEDQTGTVLKTASPSFKETLKIIFSLSAMAVAIPYACSFGSELSMNSVLSDYYAKNFPGMNQTQTGQWAAMFGLLNIVCRPAGGALADIVYRCTDSVWSKKIVLLFFGVTMGSFQLAIGLADPKNQATMFGLVAGLAFFLEACNGANFALVPHVHPYANGIVSGTVGGMGNLGGIVFAIIFRYNGSHYARSLWIIGTICIAGNVAISWVHPVPRRKLGLQPTKCLVVSG